MTISPSSPAPPNTIIGYPPRPSPPVIFLATQGTPPPLAGDSSAVELLVADPPLEVIPTRVPNCYSVLRT